MWWIVLFFLIGVFSFILFARLLIEIDSSINLYRVKYGGVAEGDIVFMNNSIQFEIKFLFWKKIIHIKSNTEPFENKIRSNTVENKNRNDVPITKMFIKTCRVLRSFKITKCYISVDTGNMPLNGILFPYFYLISINSKRTIKINFLGENKIILKIENSLARMLWAFVKS